MAVITSQKITSLYERYKAIDVTFTKEIIQVSGLITNQVFIKCVGDFWPCVIFSTSFQGARIVANLKTGITKKIEQANNMTSLRFSFRNPDTGNPVTFFVNAKSAGTAPYGNSADMGMITLQFTQRPPDDLIDIMGRILDANINSAKRKEERILITADSQRRLGLHAKESVIFIQGVPRRCILRDISFSGAKVIMVGVEKFLVNKEVALRMDFDDPRESLILKGKFIRAEPVEGRKELAALALVLDESLIPMGYKIRINDFLSQVRADTRGSEDHITEKKENNPVPPAPTPAAAAAPSATAAGAPKTAPAAAVASAAPKTVPAATAAAAPKTAPAEAAAPAVDEDFDLKLPNN